MKTFISSGRMYISNIIITHFLFTYFIVETYLKICAILNRTDIAFLILKPVTVYYTSTQVLCISKSELHLWYISDREVYVTNVCLNGPLIDDSQWRHQMLSSHYLDNSSLDSITINREIYTVLQSNFEIDIIHEILIFVSQRNSFSR